MGQSGESELLLEDLNWSLKNTSKLTKWRQMVLRRENNRKQGNRGIKRFGTKLSVLWHHWSTDVVSMSRNEIVAASGLPSTKQSTTWETQSSEDAKKLPPVPRRWASLRFLLCAWNWEGIQHGVFLKVQGWRQSRPAFLLGMGQTLPQLQVHTT